MVSPEAQARQHIDRLLEQAGWHICDAANVNLHAAQGVAIRDPSARSPMGTHAVRPKSAGKWMCQHHTRNKRLEPLNDDFRACVTGVVARYETGSASRCMRHRTNNPNFFSIV